MLGGGWVTNYKKGKPHFERFPKIEFVLDCIDWCKQNNTYLLPVQYLLTQLIMIKQFFCNIYLYLIYLPIRGDNIPIVMADF